MCMCWCVQIAEVLERYQGMVVECHLSHNHITNTGARLLLDKVQRPPPFLAIASRGRRTTTLAISLHQSRCIAHSSIVVGGRATEACLRVCARASGADKGLPNDGRRWSGTTPVLGATTCASRSGCAWSIAESTAETSPSQVFLLLLLGLLRLMRVRRPGQTSPGEHGLCTVACTRMHAHSASKQHASIVPAPPDTRATS